MSVSRNTQELTYIAAEWPRTDNPSQLQKVGECLCWLY